MVGANNANAFDAMKASVMANLAEHRDKSPKGFLDAPILDLVCFINSLPDYVTTSSCSGRVALFHRSSDGANKGGTWLLAKHAQLDADELRATLVAKLPADGSVLLKHEPLVLHVQCRDATSAQRMLRVAMAAGMRESGISLGGKKTMLGIRTTANMLELPVAQDGKLIFPEECLEAMQVSANERFVANLQRTNVFAEKIRAEFDSQAVPQSSSDKSATATETGGSDGLWRLVRDPDGKALDSCVLRWGHTATTVGAGAFGEPLSADSVCSSSSIVVFGGLGLGEAGSIAQSRLNDVVRLKTVPGSDTIVAERLSVGGAKPQARVRHSASLVQKNKIVYFGGRASPIHPFGDVAVLDVSSVNPKWLPSVTFTSSQAPAARWSHGSAVVGESIFIYGGRNASTVFNDLWKLDLSSNGEHATWERIDVPSGPGPRFMHAMLAMGDRIVVYGGMHTRLASEDQGYDGSIFVFDTTAHVWMNKCKTSPALPARFGHVATAWTPHEFVVVGGVCKDATNNGVCVITLSLETSTGDFVAESETLASNDKYAGGIAPYCMLQRTALAVLPASDGGSAAAPGRLVAVGGGALCFSFGFQFSPALCFDVTSLKQLRNSGGLSASLASTDTALELLLAGDHLGREDRPDGDTIPQTVVEVDLDEYGDEKETVLTASLPPQYVKAAKVALESRGWLDKRFRIVKCFGLSDGEVLLGLPLVGRPEGVHQVSIYVLAVE
jgi:tRNA(Phe) wybutosine-synthesizing methylase Tyw3